MGIDGNLAGKASPELCHDIVRLLLRQMQEYYNESQNLLVRDCYSLRNQWSKGTLSHWLRSRLVSLATALLKMKKIKIKTSLLQQGHRVHCRYANNSFDQSKLDRERFI